MSAPKGKGRGNKLCAENCTAAHLLTAALEKVLQQEKIITTKSTYSSATKAGMTITYNGEITADLLSEITDEVNNMIASDVAIKTYKEPREKALEYHHSSRPIPDALTECAVFEVEGAVKLCCEETHLPSAAGVKKFAVLKSKRKKPRNKDDGSVVNGSYEFLFVIAEAADKVLAKKAGACALVGECVYV